MRQDGPKARGIEEITLRKHVELRRQSKTQSASNGLSAGMQARVAQSLPAVGL